MTRIITNQKQKLLVIPGPRSGTRDPVCRVRRAHHVPLVRMAHPTTNSATTFGSK